MANVLPPDALKKISGIYRARFVFVSAVAVGALTALFVLALVPSFIVLSTAVPPAHSVAAEGAAPDSRAAARAQALVGQFTPALSSTTSPAAIFAAAIGARPSGVTINHLAFTVAQAGRGAELLLAGKAPREKIGEYRDALSAHPLFASVTVPVSSLVGTESGDFSMTIRVRVASSTF